MSTRSGTWEGDDRLISVINIRLREYGTFTHGSLRPECSLWLLSLFCGCSEAGYEQVLVVHHQCAVCGSIGFFRTTMILLWEFGHFDTGRGNFSEHYSIPVLKRPHERSHRPR